MIYRKLAEEYNIPITVSGKNKLNNNFIIN